MSKREKKIVEIVHQHGDIKIKELSDLLGTSTSSIRRDLIALNNNRFINRKHGSVSLSTIVNYEDRWFNRTPVDQVSQSVRAEPNPFALTP